MIQVQALTKRYGSVTAVDGLTFTARPGTVTGFLGPNGAGKSTTMRVVVGLERPTSGTATVDGRRYADLPAPLRTVGVMLDARSVHPGRTAFRHLRALARTHGIGRGRVDEVIGMIHVKDVFAVLAEGRTPPPLLDLLRQPLYVPQSMGVLDLLAEMRAKRTHLAIVIDEYSGTDGLVTIEDLVEEIVGEIEDEHDDEPTALFVPGADGCWDADARAELDDIGEVIDPRLAEVDEDVDTLGGLAAVLAGHVPAVGEVLHHSSGWRIEITEADEKRVHRLRLHPPVVVDLEASADRGADF